MPNEAVYDSCVNKRAVHCFIVGHCKHVLPQREERKSKGSLCVVSMRMCMCVLLLFPPNSSTLEANRPDTRAHKAEREREKTRGERDTETRTPHRCHVLSVSVSLSWLSSLSLSLCCSATLVATTQKLKGEKPPTSAVCCAG